MDELRLWNIGRAGVDIQADMRRQLFGNEPGLVAYWRFDESRGPTAADVVGTLGNAATLINGPAWVTALIEPFAFTVTTSPILDLTATSAMLGGSVGRNSSGSSGLAYFTWSGNGSRTNTTTPVALPSGNAPLPWSNAVSALTHNRFYSYRAVAPNEYGPSYGAEQFFCPSTDVTVPSDPIVPTSQNSPGSEVVANAVDNPPRKDPNFDVVNPGFTVTPQTGDPLVGGLTLTSANDAPERDPAAYELFGSDNGSPFVGIGGGNLPPFPSRLSKTFLFFPSNARTFKSYRLIFPTVVGPNALAMQIAEVELIGLSRPELLITRAPADPVVLSWATNYPGCEWEGRASLTSGKWRRVSSSPVVVGRD